MKKIVVGCTLGLALISGGVMAAGDANVGKRKAVICANCHGPNGITVINDYPNLKGQNELYLIQALKSYRAKERNRGLGMAMTLSAMMLSDQDIKDLAAYYSSLK